MDSRTNTSHSAYPRPLSQPALRDPRHAPIPPPPYTLQAPVRTAHPLNHDPFLPRRNDYEDTWQEQSKPPPQGPFSLGTYAASAPRDALATATENRERVQDNSGNWRFADGRIDRYRSQSGDGKQSLLGYICFLSLHTQRSVCLCSFALLLHVRACYPLFASPFSHTCTNGSKAHISGLRQPLELFRSGSMALLPGHRTRRHQSGGDQIHIRPGMDVHKLFA